jgi:hypothetical protein
MRSTPKTQNENLQELSFSLNFHFADCKPLVTVEDRRARGQYRFSETNHGGAKYENSS